MNEKRRFNRIFHDANTCVTNKKGTEQDCKLLDISLNGCLILLPQTNSPYQSKEALNVNILLADEVSIKANAHVVFIRDNEQLGVQFDEIDIDSITTLRRLVELNMGDCLMLERNLQALGRVKDTDSH